MLFFKRYTHGLNNATLKMSKITYGLELETNEVIPKTVEVLLFRCPSYLLVSNIFIGIENMLNIIYYRYHLKINQ